MANGLSTKCRYYPVSAGRSYTSKGFSMFAGWLHVLFIVQGGQFLRDQGVGLPGRFFKLLERRTGFVTELARAWRS